MWGVNRWTRLMAAMAVFACGSCLMPPAAAQADMLSLAEGFLVGGSPGHILKSASPGGKRSTLFNPLECTLTLGPLGDARQFLEAETLPFERIQDIMGAAPEVPALHADVEGFPGRCYVSGRADDPTAVLFLRGTNGMVQGMAVFADRRMLEPQITCVPTINVHAQLRTRQGLRLGMSRHEVESLLGAPHGRDGSRFGYESVAWIPVTKAVLRRFGWEQVSDEARYMRAQEIVIWFKNGRVVGFSVEQHSHYN